MNEGDIRAEVFLKLYENLQVEGSNYEAYVFNKFPGNSELRTSSNNNLMNMSKPFRLSEMYLIAAEAEARLNHMEDANKYLNTFLKVVEEEREREFIGEGMRMSDIRRYGKGFKRVSLHEENETLDKIIVKQGKAIQYKANDYRLTWPIPKAELDANPILKGQQNPGY